MRNLLLAITFFVSLCSVAIAGPKEDALQVLEKWTKAFSDSDVDGIVSTRPTRLSLAPAASRLSSSRTRFASTSSKRC